MSNMSYCRFQNTLSDLQDCVDALEAMRDDPGAETALSRAELAAAKGLVQLCATMIEVALNGADHNLDLDELESNVDIIQAECAVAELEAEEAEEAEEDDGGDGGGNFAVVERIAGKVKRTLPARFVSEADAEEYADKWNEAAEQLERLGVFEAVDLSEVQTEKRVDWLCGCGNGRLAVLESEVPANCGTCGREIGGVA